MPRLSIIVPVYNSEKYLDRCVASILAQDMADFQLLLVDDGSTDGSLALCQAYAAQDGRVQVLHQDNRGQGAARNAGLAAAQGDYIAFADSDDWLEQGLFTTALARCQEQELDLLCFEITIVREGQRRPSRHFAGERLFTGAEALQHLLTDAIDTSCVNKIYRRQLWSRVRFTENRYYEDVATVYKVLAQARRVGYLEESYYNYYRHSGSTIATSFNSRSRYDQFLGYKERYEYALEHCPAALAKCRLLAVKKAVGVLTAVEAGRGGLSQEQEAQVAAFIREHRGAQGLDVKSRLLAWGACHCRLINRWYGRLSLLSKKLRG